jgi:hypothetical protein
MKIVVLDGPTGIRVYTDEPADIVGVHENAFVPNTRELLVNKGSDEEWTLRGAFYKSESNVDSAFVASVFEVTPTE